MRNSIDNCDKFLAVAVWWRRIVIANSISPKLCEQSKCIKHRLWCAMPKKAYREGHKAVSRPKGLGDVQPSSKNMARSFSLPGHINSSSPVEEDSIGGASVVSTLSANHKDIITSNHTSGKGESVHNGIKDHLRSKFKFHAHVHAQDSNNSIQVLSLNKPRGHFFFQFRLKAHL